MKLLFLSDTQLGGGEVYGTPEQPRLRDAADALTWVARIVEERWVDLVVFAGDAFDRRRPAVDELLVFARFLGALDCPYVLLAGNHDARGPGLPTTLDLFGERGANVYTEPATRHLDDRARLAFLPWSHPGPMRAAREGATPLEQAEALLKIAEGLHAEVAKFQTRILVTHHALSGMSLPNGLSTGELVGEPVLDTQALLEQGWSAVVAGHVHKHEVAHAYYLDDEGALGDPMGPGVAISLGSPWVQDFGEADGFHGVTLYDTDAGTFESVELQGRRFVTIDATDGPDLSADGLAGPQADDLEGAVVRVRITCTEQAARELDLDAIRSSLIGAGAHKVYAVTLDVERAVRARAEGMAEDAGPLAALEGWLRATNQGPRECERLRALTFDLLTQED